MSSNIGPLTTTFTPPASCVTENYKYLRTDWNCGHTTRLQYCGWYHLGNISDTSCNPSGFKVDSSTSYYYSPGVCPTPYTTACSSVSGGETIATCCPSGYKCQTDTFWPWFHTDLCTHAEATTSRYVVTFYTSNSKLTSTTTSGSGINAYGIQIRNGDAGTGSTPASVSASATSTETGSGTGGSSSNSGSGGLSTGAKAGIGVGAGIGGLLVLLFGAFFAWKVRQSQQKGQTQAQAQVQTPAARQRQEYRTELPGVSNVNVPTELDVPPTEMGTGGSGEMVELEGDKGGKGIKKTPQDPVELE